MGDRRVSLAELLQRGARLASALRAGGVKEDCSVALMLRNDYCFLESLAATGMLGAYAVPINWHQKGGEVRFILRDANASVLLIHADLLAGIRESVPPGVRVIAAETPPEIAAAYGVPAALCRVPEGVEELARVQTRHEPMADLSRMGSRGSIVYTSGTTGRPKGVKRLPLEPAAARAFSDMCEQWFGLRPGIRTVMAAPMYHSAPILYARGVLRTGGSVTLMPRFEAEGLLRIIERERITHLIMVPTMFVRLLRLPEEVRRRYDLSSLEFVIHGAAPCPQEVKRRMISWWGPVIHEYYGATETGTATRSSSEEWLARPGTVGKAWPGREVRIYSEEGRRLGPGEVGEIYVSLAGVPNFTYQNAHHERLRIEKDGLVTAGDVGYLDEEGYLFIVDRKKDMVISGGVNIYPAEIECALAEHPQVADSAVIGIPDEEYGERLAAFVQLVAGEEASEEELRSFLKARIANYKVPRMLTFVKELPRDDSGKLLKRTLRESYWRDRQIKI
ncbi:MAG: AMP-binding protein [Betaproteobacteria bacterium]|nr:AMP-binding protein [Betaproteobacteria bacterium]